MNYYKLGFAVSFIIHLLFVTLAFYIKKPVAQENMEVVLEFNVTNVIKTGEHDTDKNTKKTAEVIENNMSIPAMVKQETKNTVEEKVEQEEQEITYSAEYFKTQKEEMLIPEKVKRETKNTMDEKILAKAVEVTKKVKQPVADTKRESKSTAYLNIGGQSGGIPKSADMPHELEQSAENQYIKEHFDYINNIVRINISYPYKAQKMSMEGNVIISFIVCLDGSVKGIKINKSSGFLTLDNNAEKAVRKASPFPPPPVEVQIVVPVTYKLNT
ncbi:MAG: energy transducer TonB [Candidatus Scalindua sp.]|jgi:TonB family protein|nr:energy transducer TonB [Candidatus Scalindua sp.]